MTLTALGWAVVHSIWVCTFLAGLTAMVLSVLPDSRARVRHAIAYGALLLMAVLPLVIALADVDPLGEAARRPVMAAVDGSVGIASVLSWRAWLVPSAAILWMTGVALSLVGISRQWQRARLLTRQDVSDAGEPVGAIVSELLSRLGVQDGVHVRQSGQAAVPMVLGCLRPVVLIPAHTAADLSVDQLRAILAHELAHVRRRDYLANVLQVFAETLVFHHPAARWVSRRVRTEREYCCDDVAVSVGANRADYARALAALEDARADCRLAVAAGSGTLLDRIQRIVGHPRPGLTPVRGVAVLVCASVLASVLLAMTAVVPPDLPLDVKMRSKSPGPTPTGVTPTPAYPRRPAR
jgi:beta-lactamase regulating signal transducer with metallopeptidase domain